MQGVQIKWIGEVLSPRAIAESPQAQSVLESLHLYDEALARHGAPERLRIPDGFEVLVFDQDDVGRGAADSIELSTRGRTLRVPTTQNTDVTWHELGHGSVHRSPMSIEAAKEGWPDAVARAIAIERDDDAVRPWSMVRDGFRRDPDAPWGDMRDPMTERHAHVADLDERVSLARAYETSRFGDAERDAIGAYLGIRLSSHARGYHLLTMVGSSHAEAGIITKPAAIASGELGAKLVAGAYLDAFAQLPGYVRNARHDIATANQAGDEVPYAVMRTGWYAELLGSARSTIDSVESAKRGAGDVMRSAWREVGVEA